MAFGPYSTFRLMEDPVWHRLDQELASRRERHLVPGSWAELARALDTSEQRINNWKRRGVPPKQHAAVAAALGWSVDRLIGLDEPQRALATPNGNIPLTEVEKVAAAYANLSPAERRRFLHLLAAARDDAPMLGIDWETLWTTRSKEQLIDETAPRRVGNKKRRLG